jgi:hypothetical protein
VLVGLVVLSGCVKFVSLGFIACVHPGERWKKTFDPEHNGWETDPRDGEGIGGRYAYTKVHRLKWVLDDFFPKKSSWTAINITILT